VIVVRLKKGYRMVIETARFAVTGWRPIGNWAGLSKQRLLELRRLRSLLRKFGAEHVLDSLPLLAKRKPGRPQNAGKDTGK
jgi:hypothetical protein